MGNGQWFVKFCMIMLAVISFKTFSETVPGGQKILFVYDTLDDKSSFFITAFREVLKELPYTVDEAAVEHPVKKDMALYDVIVLYSRVMAFDMKSPVRTWIGKQKTFGKKKMLLFVTANRWFSDKNYTKLLGMLKKRDATMVDAVTMATKDMSENEKKEMVRTHLSKISEE